MDISIRQLQAAPTPNIQPLALVDPNLLDPTSGVAAYDSGIATGQAISKPITSEINDVTQYYTPQEQALRKARIAEATLATTNATQQNSAAEATPDVPLQQRQVQGQSLGLNSAKINQELTLLPQEGNVKSAEMNRELTLIPSETASELTGNSVKNLQGHNFIATTPNYSEDVTSANDASSIANRYQDIQANHPELDLPEMNLSGRLDANGTAIGDDGQQQQMKRALAGINLDNKEKVGAAIDQAKVGSSVARAGNPFLQGGGMPGFYWNGKEMAEDTITQRQIMGEDGQVYIQDVYAHTGKPVQGNDPKLSARNVTVDTAAARSGVALPNMSEAQKGIATNASSDPNLNPKASINAQAIGRQFNSTVNNLYRPKMQLIQGFDSVAKTALDPNTSGAADVDLIDTAGRLYKGGAMTETQFEAIKNSSGIPDAVWNAPAVALKGKVLTPQQRSDLIESVNNFKVNLQKSYENDYNAKAQQLPAGADPERYLGPRSYFSASNPTADPLESSPGQTAASIPTVSPEDAAKLPIGTQFKGVDGVLRIRQ